MTKIEISDSLVLDIHYAHLTSEKSIDPIDQEVSKAFLDKFHVLHSTENSFVKPFLITKITDIDQEIKLAVVMTVDRVKHLFIAMMQDKNGILSLRFVAKNAQYDYYQVVSNVEENIFK